MNWIQRAGKAIFVIVLWGITVWLVGTSIWGPDGLVPRKQLADDNERLSAEIAKLEHHIRQLSERISVLEDDAEAQQDAVRERTGRLRADEVILIPTEASGSDDPSAQRR